MLRVAVVGMGRMGFVHSRILTGLPEVRLVAVVDENPHNLAKAVEELQRPGFASTALMLGTADVDLALVAVAPNRHLEAALPLILAGVDVIVEKPIESTLDAAQEMIAAARRHEVRLGVCQSERFNPAFLRTMRYLEEGAISVRHVATRRYGANPKRGRWSCGPGLDLGIHDADLVLQFMDSDWQVVESAIEDEAQDTESIRARITSEALTAEIQAGWSNTRPERELRVDCGESQVVCDLLNQTVRITKRGGMEQRLQVSGESSHEAFLSATVAAVEAGLPLPVPAEEGLRALELVLTMIDLAKSRPALDRARGALP